MAAPHHRRSIRLGGYDYAQAGAYFVTLCTHRRRCFFGEIVGGAMRLNRWGRIVAEEWLRTARIRAEVELDAWVIMPNHFHAIVVIHSEFHDEMHRRGDRPVAPTMPTIGPASPFRDTAMHPVDPPSPPTRPNGPPPGSLGAIMAGFKAAVTTRINRERQARGTPVWQRNYWEHIIRDEVALQRLRAYIEANPANWPSDRLAR